MSEYNFGAGYLFGRRTDNVVTTNSPTYFGVCQSFDLSHDQTIKELRGQFKYAVDAAAAAQKITGKISFARVQANSLNDMFFGQSLTTSSGRQISVVVNGLPEQHVASTTVTVTNSANFAEDLGVFYVSGTGIVPGKQLTRVASAPAVGSYSVNEATGVYTFNAGETATVSFFYEYTVTTLSTIGIANPLMGAMPSIEMHMQNYYVNNLGTLSSLHLKLNAVRGSKLDWKFKSDDYMMQDFEFTAFADATGQVGTYDFNE